MKPLALFLALCLGAAAAARAGDLTDAAKESKAKRRKSTSKVITNTDVKRSKGKIQTTNVPDTPVAPEPSMMEKYNADRAAKLAADEKRIAAEQKVASLEKELTAIEQSYYEENDLTKRDTVVVKHFNDVKARLDAARIDLASLAKPQP
jgi:predicted  nucleic acid-binding Zn-ribbon protein